MLEPPPLLHQLETEVMEVLWERGESCVREVMDALNVTGARTRAYTTYMTIMSRLEAKGMLERRRHGKTNFYRPACSRHEYVERRARSELDSVVDQYGEVALAHIARQMAALDPKRRRALERLAREK